MKRCAIVIPTYCESENIASLCEHILEFCPNAKIIVVDDSPDMKTVHTIECLTDDRVSVTHREEKGGRGSAVILGINQILPGCYDYILEMDADFSHPPQQIPELVEYACANKLDLVIASRYRDGSKILNWQLSRRIFSKCANFLAKTLLRVPSTDYTNGFRLYSSAAAQEVVKSCGKYGSGFIALSEILVNLYYRGYKVGEVSTIFVNRVRGKSSLSRKEIMGAIKGLFLIWRLKRELAQ